MKIKEDFGEIDLTVFKKNKPKNEFLLGNIYAIDSNKSLITLFVFLFILIFIVILGKSSAELLINEVMYNPLQNDNCYEWIELYNPSNNSINISGWSLTDNSATDFLLGNTINGNGTTIIPQKSYALITDQNTKIYENSSIFNKTIKLFVDDSSIGNGLGNSGDKIILKNSTGASIDDVEWIVNYTDVTGSPADEVFEGSSLSRYQNIDTNNSSKDFHECISPTPGSINTFLNQPKFEIALFPRYIPKIYNKCEHGLAFGIKIKIENYPKNETYQIKSYVLGDLSSKYPASQTWNGDSWKYSYYYSSDIQTDKGGNWSGWRYLRLKKAYAEYNEKIQHNRSAYIIVKIKGENSTFETYEKVYLLDLDNSTANGTSGGCVIGKFETDGTLLGLRTAIIENESGVRTGVYLIEDNCIEEGLISEKGYYKITSSIGKNYTLKILDIDGSVIHQIKNLSIKPGIYDVKLSFDNNEIKLRKNQTIDIPIYINNTGDFLDKYNLKINHATTNLHPFLLQKNISIEPGESGFVKLHVKPNRFLESFEGKIIISATSTKDIGVTFEIELKVEILVPDLTIRDIKIYNENKIESCSFGEGEVVRIKAFFKNQGNINATDANLNFYYDCKDQSHFIGCKNYSSIGKYQKYPSVLWDTKNIACGNHTIIVVADKEHLIDELYEDNNELSFKLNILDSKPNAIEKDILITQLYYYSHPGLYNEFIRVHNPNNESCNISGWYITYNPLNFKLDQRKIIFPKGTIIPVNGSIVLTENASSYIFETGNTPDFEYNYDSMTDVDQLQGKYMKFSNRGGVVTLKDSYNHTIDNLVYGDNNYSGEGWNGKPILGSREGVVLRRNSNRDGIFIDTNSSKDWINNRIFKIGQSCFPIEKIDFIGKIQTFVSPDCSYDTIINELKNANQSIYLNLYEFTSSSLCDEIIFALVRNISVNILMEGSPIGGISKEEKYILNRIADHGGDIRFISSDIEKKVYSRYRFNHAKYLVVDNITTIVESCNWANTGIPEQSNFGNREWGIIIRNQTIAKYFSNIFQEDFNHLNRDIYSFRDMKIKVSPDENFKDYRSQGNYLPIFKSEVFHDNFSVIPVLSPDNSHDNIINMINSAKKSIFIEQLYIYENWSDSMNPFIEALIDKSKSGIDIKVILNYNPYYSDTNEKSIKTKNILEKNGIEVKFIFTNWSVFSNIHNKGMIVDNTSVLISSINWNENSVTQNRESGIIIDSPDVAKYYADVFFYDWNLKAPKGDIQLLEPVSADFKNTIYIVILFTLTFALIARDWRNRKWK